MEISPVSFEGTYARRKMMTPTKLKALNKKIAAAKALQTKQVVQQKVYTTTRNIPSNCRQVYF